MDTDNQNKILFKLLQNIKNGVGKILHPNEGILWLRALNLYMESVQIIDNASFYSIDECD